MTAIIFASAILSGIVAGLLPGIGTTIVIVIAYPLLSKLSVTEIFMFYIVMVSTLQYYGSIGSIIFGILGEPTSAPAVLNGHELYRRGKGELALSMTATGSFIAGAVGIAMFWVLANHSDILVGFLSGKIKSTIILFAMIVLVWVSSQRIIGLIISGVGLSIGIIGSDIVTYTRLVFPKYTMFDGGIPITPIMIGLIVVPMLYHFIKHPILLPSTVVNNVTFRDRVGNLLDFTYLPSIIRGSIIGCLSGIIPGVSYSISSNMAESCEKVINKRGRHDTALMQNLVSAESANNAASVTVIAPMLIFALPIIPSESIILGLVETKGYVIYSAAEYFTNHLPEFLIALMMANLINWVVSGYYYKTIVTLYDDFKHVIYKCILVLSLGIVLVVGYSDHQLLLSVFTLAVFTAMGFIIRSDSLKMVLLFSIFVSNDLMPELYRQYLIYFT